MTLIEQIEALEKRSEYVDSLKDKDDDAWGSVGTNLDFDARAFLIDNAAALKQALADAEKLHDATRKLYQHYLDGKKNESSEIVYDLILAGEAALAAKTPRKQ